MAQTSINIRMDEGLKREFDSLCNDFGLSMTAAFTVFAKAVVRLQKIPFEISKDAPDTQMQQALADMSAKERILHRIAESNIPRVRLETDENGNLTVDKDLYPNVHDWLVNG